MLGDSLTFGWGVPFGETTAKRLHMMLINDSTPPYGRGDPVEVINAGVGNYNPAMEVAWFFDEGVKYRPDVVVGPVSRRRGGSGAGSRRWSAANWTSGWEPTIVGRCRQCVNGRCRWRPGAAAG